MLLDFFRSMTHFLQSMKHYFSNQLLILSGVQESADNVSSDSASASKDALLEEACKKYDEATHLCPTLHDVCKGTDSMKSYWMTAL